MISHARWTTTICAAALAFGLAACSGGGGIISALPTPEDIKKARDRAVAFAAALDAAKTLRSGGMFDDSSHGVAVVVRATNDGTDVTIEVTETGTPTGGSPRTGDFVRQDTDPASIAGWTGARFGRGDGAEKLVVYVDVGNPERMPFTPENLNRLNVVSGLTGETVPASGLVVEAAWLPVIRSTSLAAAPADGSITYPSRGTGSDAGLTFEGSFSGAAGEYRCSGSNCSVTLDDMGMPTAMAGAWSFVPGEGAMVTIPDSDHLHFGWWLKETDGVTAFQSFADAEGFAAEPGTVTPGMTGSATYAGSAAGVWATLNVSGGQILTASTGEFTAEAALTAHFYGALDAGVVNGEIRSFKDGAGKALTDWRVTLNEAQLAAGSDSFAGKAVGTVGSGSMGRGHWQGRFHGSDGAETNARPSHASGRFDLHFPGAHIAGAFGAKRAP